MHKPKATCSNFRQKFFHSTLSLTLPDPIIIFLSLTLLNSTPHCSSGHPSAGLPRSIAFPLCQEYLLAHSKQTINIANAPLHRPHHHTGKRLAIVLLDHCLPYTWLNIVITDSLFLPSLRFASLLFSDFPSSPLSLLLLVSWIIVLQSLWTSPAPSRS